GRARRSLGQRAAAAWQEGSRTDPKEAIAYALREAGLERPSRSRAAADGPSLTPRQRQVALLIAQGLTDRQIASRLGISVRTAESHTEQVRTKLGHTSRAQVAAWAAQSGLAGR